MMRVILSLKIHRFSSAAFIAIVLQLSGCSFSYTRVEYDRGIQAAKASKFTDAVTHFKKVLQRDPESETAIHAAREGARISFYELKNYDLAIYYLEHLVKHSLNERERRESQEKIANIYFENKTDFRRAIDEFNKLLILRNSNIEQADLHFKLAKSHFNINNFQEAQNEVEEALKMTDEAEKKFEMSLFLGNIYFNTKRAEEAAKMFEELIIKYPEYSDRDKVFLSAIACYEELEQFDKAIDKLQVIREKYGDKEFIDLKIRRLKERKANLPGSKGLRK